MLFYAAEECLLEMRHRAHLLNRVDLLSLSERNREMIIKYRYYEDTSNSF